ncbi:metal-dependent hydrolase [Phormidesmis sp. 146-12]
MSITHATIATAGVSLILGTADPLALCLALVGSQLPDIDTSTSTIGKILFPISNWIEERYPHRTITHSLLATLGIAAFSLAIGSLTQNISVWAALPLGHLLACFSDCFTKQGVMLFYPYPVWAVSVANPRRRITTGSATELWVLSLAIVLLLVGVHAATGGGITQNVVQALGMREAAVDVYNQKASSNHIYAQINGIWSSDRTRVDGRFFIVAVEGNEFVVSDGKGLYQTGKQILADRVTPALGSPATTQVISLAFNDEEIAPKLQEVMSAHPGALILLTGQMSIDVPERVQFPMIPNHLQTAALSGSTAVLNHHPIEQAVQGLSDQYGTGTLALKVISPRPITPAIK